MVLGVGLPPVQDVEAAKRLSGNLVDIAERVLRRVEIKYVFAEGGATSAELVRRMKWSRLEVRREWSRLLCSREENRPFSGRETFCVNTGQAMLAGIFFRLYLCNCRAQNTNLYLVGDFQNHRVAVNTAYSAINSAAGDDFVAVLQLLQHRLRLFSLALLRKDEHHVKNAHYDYHHHQRTAENSSGRPACLP